MERSVDLPALVKGEISPPMGMIEKLCEERERLLAVYRDIFEKQKALGRDDYFSLPEVLDRRYAYAEVRRNMERITPMVDASLWDRAVRETGLYSVMNREQLRRIREEIRRDPPPVERDTMAATLVEHCRNAGKTFVEGLIDVFRALDSRYRSHGGIKLGSRLILSGLYWNGFESFSSCRETFDDISRAFMLAEGKNPSALTFTDQHSRILEKARIAGEMSAETDYFHARFFKNGNVHLYPKREDLLEKLNNLVAAYYGETLGDSRPSRRHTAPV